MLCVGIYILFCAVTVVCVTIEDDGNKKKITMLKVASTGFRIDTKKDLERAIEIFL